MHAGCRHLSIPDSQSNCTIPVVILYPTRAKADEVRFGPFAVHAAADAPAADGPFPMVVISHGSGGNHLGYLGIARHLAENGFVVALPEHPGNNRNDNHLEGTRENLILRPRHVRLVLDRLQADPDLHTTSQAAVIGHSMGGYTALALAGGQPWMGPGDPVVVEHDDRIAALVLLAPATPWFTPKDALARVTVPILMLTAQHDPYTPPDHGERVSAGVHHPRLVRAERVENAGHFSFLCPFPEVLRRPGFLPATDPEGFDRAAFHRRLHVDLETFICEALSGAASA